jgi:hypothetical protein
LHPLFAGEVSGVDLRAPLAPATVAARGRRWDMNEPRELRRTTTTDSDAAASGGQAAVLETAVEK